MSRLKIFRPDESLDEDYSADSSEPTILKFPQADDTVSQPASASQLFPVHRFRRYVASNNDQTVERARLIHSNRTCPSCGRGNVEPITLQDAATNRTAHAIPGTSTIVGFHCCSCGSEWATPRLVAITVSR